jgi:molybdopterin converting factor small subunit
MSNQVKTERNQYVFAARVEGATFKDIAETCGISQGRALQIYENELNKKYQALKLKGADIVALNNNEVFALSDYLRHQLAIEYPMEQYFIEKAATALEDLANERAELKHQIQLLTTPIIDKSNEEVEVNRKKQLGNLE